MLALLAACSTRTVHEHAPRLHLVTEGGGGVAAGFGVAITAVRGEGNQREGRSRGLGWLPMARLRPVEVPAPLGAAIEVDGAVPFGHTPAPRPGGARPTDRWIDIELASQTLVAYEGDRPVWATRVSTGQGVYATPTGVFRMYAKRERQTMSNRDKPGMPPYYFEDVPWVQFFNQAIALHGAYWHRRFGQPVSHGCVNLAPDDARWLYRFTRLPDPLGPGTLVRVR